VIEKRSNEQFPSDLTRKSHAISYDSGMTVNFNKTVPPKFTVFLLIIVFSLGIVGCSPLKAINFVSPKNGYHLYADIPYGEEERQKLDIYRPNNGKPPTAIIVFFYGGSWQRGHKSDYRFIAQTLTQQGFVVVIPDYRVYPEVKFPEFIHDGARAIVWTHNNSKDYLDHQLPIFVSGHSAGAHIAAMLNYDERYLVAANGDLNWLSGLIGLAGPYDFLPITSPKLLKVFDTPESREAAQPIHFVDGSEAPALLIHGTNDKAVWPRNSINLAALVKKKSGQAETLILDGKNHASLVLAFSRGFRSRSQIVGRIGEFVTKHSNNNNNHPRVLK